MSLIYYQSRLCGFCLIITLSLVLSGGPQGGAYGGGGRYPQQNYGGAAPGYRPAQYGGMNAGGAPSPYGYANAGTMGQAPNYYGGAGMPSSVPGAYGGGYDGGAAGYGRPGGDNDKGKFFVYIYIC